MVSSRAHILNQEFHKLNMVDFNRSNVLISQYFFYKKKCYSVSHDLNILKILHPLYIKLLTSYHFFIFYKVIKKMM
jgi:hypothetical protein